MTVVVKEDGGKLVRVKVPIDCGLETPGIRLGSLAGNKEKTTITGCAKQCAKAQQADEFKINSLVTDVEYPEGSQCECGGDCNVKELTACMKDAYTKIAAELKPLCQEASGSNFPPQE